MAENVIQIIDQDGRSHPSVDCHFALEAIMYPPEQPEADTVDLVRVLQEIADERWRQDRQWGGPQHDDGHGPEVWEDLLRQHVTRLNVFDGKGGLVPAPDYRQRLVKVAALALAAAQVWDRGLCERHADAGGHDEG